MVWGIQDGAERAHVRNKMCSVPRSVAPQALTAAQRRGSRWGDVGGREGWSQRGANVPVLGGGGASGGEGMEWGRMRLTGGTVADPS